MSYLAHCLDWFREFRGLRLLLLRVDYVGSKVGLAQQPIGLESETSGPVAIGPGREPKQEQEQMQQTLLWSNQFDPKSDFVECYNKSENKNTGISKRFLRKLG